MAKRTLASLAGAVREPLDPTKDQERHVESVERKMTFSEREGLRHEIEMIERSCNQNLQGEKDDPRVLKDLYKKKMLLAHDDELTFRGNSKDMALAEVEELKEKIIKGFDGIPGIPTKNEMWPKNDISAKAQALRHNQAFQVPKMDAVVHRYQELQRRLNPDDPFAQNLDTIRPD